MAASPFFLCRLLESLASLFPFGSKEKQGRQSENFCFQKPDAWHQPLNRRLLRYLLGEVGVSRPTTLRFPPGTCTHRSTHTPGPHWRPRGPGLLTSPSSTASVSSASPA